MTLKYDSLIDMVHQHGLDVENRTIYLTSESINHLTGEEDGTNHTMYSKFIKNLDILNCINHDDIYIKAANIGGDWNYGMAMFDAISRSKSKVHYFMEAYACSMGSIIPQAAAVRYISSSSDFLVHYGSYCMDGEWKSVASTFKHYQLKTNIMIDIYANRCFEADFFRQKGYSIQQIHDFIKSKLDSESEWWMTAEDAKMYGFVDIIY